MPIRRDVTVSGRLDPRACRTLELMFEPIDAHTSFSGGKQ
ncbi:hypothetical protein GFS60_02345 [Rhodococcus sp. WAY2]|nr:hypothetical protein GFS60_02345 [Rhodococcus sp. WAY2]